jgi:flagellar FliJ protein
MKFVFSLDGVLRQRKHVEDERQRAFAVAQADVVALETQLREMDRSVQATVTDIRDNRLVGKLDLNFLAGHRRYMVAMQRKAVALAQQIAAAQRKVEDARRLLVEAAKQRKIIEKLRERRQATWAANLAQKETAALDEVGTQIGYRMGLNAAMDEVSFPDEPPEPAEVSP